MKILRKLDEYSNQKGSSKEAAFYFYPYKIPYPYIPAFFAWFFLSNSGKFLMAF